LSLLLLVARADGYVEDPKNRRSEESTIRSSFRELAGRPPLAGVLNEIADRERKHLYVRAVLAFSIGHLVRPPRPASATIAI
jgi:hypothetical protein